MKRVLGTGEYSDSLLSKHKVHTPVSLHVLDMHVPRLVLLQEGSNVPGMSTGASESAARGQKQRRSAVQSVLDCRTSSAIPATTTNH